MRILRNICLMFFPILIMINLYRFIFSSALQSDYEFRGLAYVYNYISTFNGLNGTFDMLDRMVHCATSFGHTEIVDLDSLFNAVAQFFEMVGYVFAIPVMFVVDLVNNVIWVVNIFGV